MKDICFTFISRLQKLHWRADQGNWMTVLQTLCIQKPIWSSNYLSSTTSVHQIHFWRCFWLLSTIPVGVQAYMHICSHPKPNFYTQHPSRQHKISEDHCLILSSSSSNFFLYRLKTALQVQSNLTGSWKWFNPNVPCKKTTAVFSTNRPKLLSL